MTFLFKICNECGLPRWACNELDRWRTKAKCDGTEAVIKKIDERLKAARAAAEAE